MRARIGEDECDPAIILFERTERRRDPRTRGRHRNLTLELVNEARQRVAVAVRAEECDQFAAGRRPGKRPPGGGHNVEDARQDRKRGIRRRHRRSQRQAQIGPFHDSPSLGKVLDCNMLGSHTVRI